MRGEQLQIVSAILEALVRDADLKAALVVDKDGDCLASSGDTECLATIADSHFSHGMDLGRLCRDEHGSTVLSDSSSDCVRFEAVAAGRCILTLVSADPLAATRAREAIDKAKAALNRFFVAAWGKP